MGFIAGIMAGYVVMVVLYALAALILSGLGVPKGQADQLAGAFLIGGLVGIPISLIVSHFADKH